jgi:hypothetical protein
MEIEDRTKRGSRVRLGESAKGPSVLLLKEGRTMRMDGDAGRRYVGTKQMPDGMNIPRTNSNCRMYSTHTVANLSERDALASPALLSGVVICHGHEARVWGGFPLPLEAWFRGSD